jgi:predicted transcriptional regulator
MVAAALHLKVSLNLLGSKDAISSSKNSSSRSYRNNLNDINEAQSASPLMKNTIYDTDRNNVVTNESSKLKYSEYKA